MKLLSHVWPFATPLIRVYQSPPSMEFSRQEYWSGLPFPSPGDLPNPGIELRSPALQRDPLLTEPPGKPSQMCCNEEVTNSYITVISHGKKDYWLHPSKDVNEKTFEWGRLSKIISLLLDQNMPSILGMVAVDSPKLTVASIARKQKIGWWMLCSVWMTNKMVKLPMSAIRYTAQKGKSIQIVPGFPATGRRRGKTGCHWKEASCLWFYIICSLQMCADPCWEVPVCYHDVYQYWKEAIICLSQYQKNLISKLLLLLLSLFYQIDWHLLP